MISIEPVAAPGAPLARRNPVAKVAAALVFSFTLLATLDPVAPAIAIAVELAVLPLFGVRYRVLARRALPLLLSGVRRPQALRRAYAWFERLGLDGLEQRRSGELSGGQAQRVALARGLVAEPQVLFADEPTGALDSLTGEQVMDLLVSAAREQGTTVILVTHEPRIAAYADREVMVRDGRVNAPDRIAS